MLVKGTRISAHALHVLNPSPALDPSRVPSVVVHRTPRFQSISLTSSLVAHNTVMQTKLFSLAAAYVGYIVLCNLNLNINPVGFYQISKIAVAPAVLTIDWLVYGKKSSREVIGSIAIVCLGVGMATVSDPEMSGDVFGLMVGLGSVLATALYQIWAGSIQKDLGLGSMQVCRRGFLLG